MYNVMEVAMYSPQFLGSFGNSLLALGKELRRNGNSMVLCFPEVRDWMSVFENDGFHVEILPLRNLSDRSFFPPINEIRRASKRLTALIKKYEIDVIHGHFWLESQIAVCAAKIFSSRDVKVVWHWRNPPHMDALLLDGRGTRGGNPLRGGAVWKRVAGNSGYRFLDRTCVSANITVSEEILNILKRRGLRNIRVIYNGVDVNRYSREAVSGIPDVAHVGTRDRKGIRVGNISNFRIQKDHFTFLESAKMVLEKHPETRFVLVGEGPTRPEVEGLGRRLGIADNLVFTGTLSDVRQIIADCDFTVLSSLHEGFPNVIGESMALEKPVIATDVGGTPEIVKDGENGFLVPRKNPGVMAEKMLYLIEHAEEVTRLGRNGRELVKKNFTTQRWVEQITEVLSEVAGKK